MAYFPPTGSTVAFQTDATKLAANVSVTGGFLNVLGSVATAPFPASVSGTGIFNVNHTGNGSVLAVVPGSVKTAPFPASVSGVGVFNTNPIGNGSVIAVLKDSSVAALQGTSPWLVQLTSGSVITEVTVNSGNSSVQVVGLMPAQSVSGVGLFNVNPTGSGSVLVVQPDATKLTGTMSVMGNLSVLGTVPVTQATTPWIVQPTSGSVIATVEMGNSSVQVVGLMPPQSVSGVGLFNVNHTGNGSIQTVSLGSIATAPFPASVSGVGQFTVNHVGSGSVIAVLLDSSVATLQGTNPWQITGVTSMVGGFVRTEDNAHASGDLGLHILAVRNDTIASTVTADRDYTSFGVDSAGRMLTKPFAPVESSVVATASTVNAGFGTNQAASVRVLAAPGAGLKWYITDLNVSNTGSVSALVTLTDDSSNTLWKGIAPAGGGNNMPGLNTPIVSASANTPLGLVSGTASSIIHVWVAGYKAP